MTAESRQSYALRYGAAGLPVFPLHWIIRDESGPRCSCNDADCRSPGKHPLTPNGVKDASCDPLVLTASWSRWPDANIGMAMGSASGMFAVDVDPRHGGDVTIEDLQKRLGAFPDTVNAMTGGGGQHHLFRFDPAKRLPGKLGPGVDVKGEGGYIVVEPSTHASGLSYAWEAEGDPLDGGTLAEAPEWLYAGSAEAPAKASPAAVGFLPPERVIALRSALAYLDADDRDIWIRVGMALRSTDAPNAFGLWTEWSQLSSKFDAKAQRKTWDSFRPESIHVETVFAMAAEAGWVNPASQSATRFNDQVVRAISARNGGTRTEIIEAPKVEVRPFPSRILQDVQQWVERQHGITHPLINQQVVLAIVATAAGRMYVSDEGDVCHLYLGIVSDTVDYSRYAGDIAKRVLTEAGLRRMIRGTRLGSASAIYSTLVKSPTTLHVCDEWGQLIAFAKRQPSGALDQAMNLLTSIYSMPVVHLDSAAEAGIKAGALDDQLVIYQPSLSLLALMSADQLAPLMRRGEMGKGALSQMLSVFVESDELVERKPDAGPVPQWLIERISIVRRLPPKGAGDLSLQDIFGTSPGLKPQLVRVRSRMDLEEGVAPLDAIGSDFNARPFVLAARRIARRIATGIAAFDSPSHPEITQPIMDWAVHYVRSAVSAWLDRFRTVTSDEGKISVQQQVLELIERAKSDGLAPRDLLARCWPYRSMTKDKREELIGLLLADEAIVETKTKTGRGQLLVASKYARTAEDSKNPQQFLSSSEGSNSMNVLPFSAK